MNPAGVLVCLPDLKPPVWSGSSRLLFAVAGITSLLAVVAFSFGPSVVSTRLASIAAIVCGVTAVACLIVGAAEAGAQARRKERVHGYPAGSIERDAAEIVLRAQSRRPPRLIDADAFLERFGPGVITLGLELPRTFAGPPLEETAEPVSVRSVAIPAAKMQWTAIVFAAVAFALPVAMMIRVGAIPTPLVFAAVLTLPLLLGVLLPVLRSKGYSAVELVTAVATPGRLRVSGPLGSADYTREDAVLVVQAAMDAPAKPPDAPYTHQLIVVAVPSTRGRRRRCWPLMYANPDDPAFVRLIHAWLSPLPTDDSPET